MDVMIVVIVLLIIAIILWIVNLNKSCPPCEKKSNDLDLNTQFSPLNFPSIVYKPMFSGSKITDQNQKI